MSGPVGPPRAAPPPPPTLPPPPRRSPVGGGASSPIRPRGHRPSRAVSWRVPGALTALAGRARGPWAGPRARGAGPGRGWGGRGGGLYRERRHDFGAGGAGTRTKSGRDLGCS